MIWNRVVKNKFYLRWFDVDWLKPAFLNDDLILDIVSDFFFE